jgi:hypothetical protein
MLIPSQEDAIHDVLITLSRPNSGLTYKEGGFGLACWILFNTSTAYNT